MAHEGVKCFKLVWLGESNHILTVGFTKQSKREMRMFDLRDLSTPLFAQEIDQASGVIMPFFDADLKILYLAGKGDGNIRFYELTDTAPYAFPLSEHRTSVSAKGVAMLPKRACNPLKCEAARFLKLTNTNSVEPLSFIVPRKAETFQADIFPDTFSGEASITAAQYFAGENGTVLKASMDPAKNGGKFAAAASSFAPSAARAVGGAGAASSASSGTYNGKTAAQLGKELEDAQARIADLESQLETMRLAGGL